MAKNRLDIPLKNAEHKVVKDQGAETFGIAVVEIIQVHIDEYFKNWKQADIDAYVKALEIEEKKEPKYAERPIANVRPSPALMAKIRVMSSLEHIPKFDLVRRLILK